MANDLGAALCEAGDYSPLVNQLLRIAVGVTQHDRIDLRLETVAIGQAACRQAQRFHVVQCVLTMQSNQTMHRTDEFHIAPAIGQLVSHDFRNRQIRDSRIQRMLQPQPQYSAGGTIFAVHQHLLSAFVGYIDALAHQRVNINAGVIKLSNPFYQRRRSFAIRGQTYGYKH